MCADHASAAAACTMRRHTFSSRCSASAAILQGAPLFLQGQAHDRLQPTERRATAMLDGQVFPLIKAHTGRKPEHSGIHMSAGESCRMRKVADLVSSSEAAWPFCGRMHRMRASTSSTPPSVSCTAPQKTGNQSGLT